MGTISKNQQFSLLDRQIAVRRVLLGRSTLEEEAKKRKVGAPLIARWCADPEVRGDIPITTKSNWRPTEWSRQFKERIAARVAKGEAPAQIAREVSGLTAGQVRRWSMGLDMEELPQPAPAAAKAEKPERAEELFPPPPEPARHPQRDEAVKAYRGGMMPSEIIKALDLKVTPDCIRDWEAEDRAAGKYKNPLNKRGSPETYTDEQRRAAVERWAKGESGAKLAAELGCTHSAILHWAEKFGVKRSPEAARRAMSEARRSVWGSDISEDQRRRAVARWAAGESPAAIAQDLGVSSSTIYSWARQLGVTRPPELAGARPPSLIGQLNVRPPEQREEAVRRVVFGGEVQAHVARDMRIPEQTISQWCTAARALLPAAPPAPVTNGNGHHGPPVPTPALETPAPAPAKATPPPVAPAAPVEAAGSRRIKTVQSYACPHCWEPIKLPAPTPGALIVTAGLCPTCKGEIEL